MDKEYIFRNIETWEHNVGEDFLDCFDGSVTETSFMFWCLGRGYLDKERFQTWESKYTNNSFGHSLNDYLYSFYDEDNGFSVLHSKDWEREKGDMACMILSEFISNSKTYQNRFEEFLKEY